MKTSNPEFADALVREFYRRVTGESIPRILKCLVALNDAQIWYRPNENSNAIGNLVLHVIGNARQWVLTGIADIPFDRQRQQEFDQRDIIPKQELISRLNQLATDLFQAQPILLSDALLRVRPVQVYEESGISILVHVAEHFSYHTGQISYAVKWLQNVDLEYYEI